jgi:succinoglycan biosynthesis transport protein ExoP
VWLAVLADPEPGPRIDDSSVALHIRHARAVGPWALRSLQWNCGLRNSTTPLANFRFAGSEHGAAESIPRSLVSLRDLLRVLGRRKGRIALAVLVGGLIGYLVGRVLPPSYTAEGLLVVQTQQLNIPELQTFRSERTVEPWGGRSEARVLTSQQNVERAVVDLNLEHDPGFNASLRPPLAQRLLAASWLPEGLRKAASDYWPAAWRTSELESGQAIRDEIVNDIRRDLTAESEERSYAITLSYSNNHPAKAAAIVNSVMDAYVAREVDANRAATQSAGEQLKARLDQLWADWQKSNDAIRAMERDDGLVQTAEGTITSQTMAALAAERVKLRTERASAIADRAQITTAIDNGSLNVINPKLVSPRLRSLWDQETALRRRMAEFGSELGRRHPQIVALRNDMADLETKLVGELKNIRSSLDERIVTLDERDRQLGDALALANQKASATAASRAQLEQLQREADLKRELYAQYRGRYEQTLAALGVHNADVRIASRAVPPERPSSPGPKMLGAVGGAFGLLLSCSVIVSRRWLHNRFETLTELSEVTGVQGLGALPQVSTFLRPRRTMSELVVHNPDSSIAETMRGILLRIQYLGHNGTAPNVLLVTSPNPTDGKTSLVAAMARMAARDGLKCLAIDCDFRRSALADAVDAKPRQWLSDFLLSSERGSHTKLITREGLSDALYILTRPIRPMSRRLLESPRLEEVIEGARQDCDLVLIDTPPIMKVADPMILSRFADALVMVVSSHGADRTTVLEAVSRAEITGCPLAGLVMSRVGNDGGETYSYAGYRASGY